MTRVAFGTLIRANGRNPVGISDRDVVGEDQALSDVAVSDFALDDSALSDLCVGAHGGVHTHDSPATFGGGC